MSGSGLRGPGTRAVDELNNLAKEGAAEEAAKQRVKAAAHAAMENAAKAAAEQKAMAERQARKEVEAQRLRNHNTLGGKDSRHAHRFMNKVAVNVPTPEKQRENVQKEREARALTGQGVAEDYLKLSSQDRKKVMEEVGQSRANILAIRINNLSDEEKLKFNQRIYNNNKNDETNKRD